jgi:hypothetical protein
MSEWFQYGSPHWWRTYFDQGDEEEMTFIPPAAHLIEWLECEPWSDDPMTPEGKVKAKIRKVLNEAGCWHYWPVPGGYGRRTVDVLVLHRGHFAVIEAKREGKVPTRLQDLELAAVEERGGKTFAINSDEGVKELQRWLETREWRLL